MGRDVRPVKQEQSPTKARQNRVRTARNARGEWSSDEGRRAAASGSAAGAEVVDHHLHGLGFTILNQGELAEVLAENH